jgi:sterol desaturase/sphingolipid hydroxylase (fatty acid hydroxylase superfamily)
MTIWSSGYAPLLRFAMLAALLLLLLSLQRLRPRRGDCGIANRRWRNVGLGVLSSTLVYAVMPITAVAAASAFKDAGIGLLNLGAWPAAMKFALAVIVLDLAIYWQHRLSHRIVWLWRIHRVHHTDTAFDTTLGLRFHPFEILLSMLYKLTIIAALGAPAAAVAAYELLLAAFALATHADIAIPARWDAVLRRIVVTPDWHRVHHSVHHDETNSNYGNMSTLWDRLFTSAIAQPREGHCNMRLGLEHDRSAEQQTFPALLRMPLMPAQTDDR